MKRLHRRSGRGLFLLVGLLACGGWGCTVGRPENRVIPMHYETQATPSDQQALPPAVAAAKKAFTPVGETLVDADNDFGLRFLGHLTKENAGRNVFISPSSVAMALDIVYNGAKGATEQGMAQALGLKGMGADKVNQENAALIAGLTGVDPKVELSIANSLWIKPSLQIDPAFLQTNQQFYGTEIGTLESAEKINAWVSRQTHGKITEAVSQDNVESAPSILVNAIYFKGLWSKPFQTSATKDEPFHLGNGSNKTVKMMHQSGDYLYFKGDGFQAVRLPYGEGHVDMVVLLPEPDVRYEGFLSKLTAANWKTWSLKFQQTRGAVALPRFRLEYGREISDILTKMGMGIAFTDRADFSGIAPGLPLNKIVHKTFVEVKEEGTEAAGITGLSFGGAPPPKPKTPFRMVVDRPFVCAIVDARSGAILFLGSIVEPA